MTKKLEAEVIIVGAGPAGAALGLELARCGRDVLILERAHFPRDKPCGDCVNPGAVAELRRLGLADRLRAVLSPSPLRGWRVEAPDGRAFRSDFGEGCDGAALEGWAVRRRDFDAALLDEARRAGARVRFGLRVFDLLREQERVVGVRAHERSAVREVRTSFVAGADGLRSVVRRRLGLGGRSPRLCKIALVGHLAGPDGAGRFGELRVRDGRACGYAALPDSANVTLVIPQREAADVSGRAREFMSSALAAFPEVEERVRARGLERAVMVTGPFDQRVRRAWAPGTVLVGDAAGYYDPFTGQGIYQALRSASLAAEAIVAALTDPAGERHALSRYGRRIRREFAPKRGLQHVIDAAISRPRAMSRFMAALSSDGIAARRLLRVTGDLDHPAALIDPVFWSGLVSSLVKGSERE